MLGKKALFTVAVGTGSALLTGSALYAFQLNNLTSDSQSQIQSLTRQLQAQERNESKIMNQFLECQKKGDETVAKLSDEISKARTDLEMAYLKKEGAIRDVLEEDFKRSLKLLTAAHSEHLHDQLKAQFDSLNAQFQNILEDEMNKHKNRYCEQLKQSVVKLHEVEKTIKTRKDLDEQEVKSRRLWVLCQALKDTLKNSFGAQEPKKLNNQIDGLKRIANDLNDNSLIQNVLSSLIKTASDTPVYSEDTLVQRFKNVDRLCRRVALVKEDNGSITRYLLSYLQSLLIIDNVKVDPEEVAGDKVVDISRFNTFSILARINYCLDHKQFEQGLRYANLLKGAPARVASEWIEDLRTHLEIRQAADIIESMAATYTVRSIN